MIELHTPFILQSQPRQVYWTSGTSFHVWSQEGYSGVYETWLPPHGVEPLTLSIQRRFDRCCHGKRRA